MTLREILELRKAKYLRRMGVPGNYKYIYKESDKRNEGIKEEYCQRTKNSLQREMRKLN